MLDFASFRLEFSLFLKLQEIPPRAPHSWMELRALNKIEHTNRTSTDWRIKHIRYVNMWDNSEIIQEDRQYDETTYHNYRRWYQGAKLYTVFIKGQLERGFDRPLSPPRDSIEILAYVPDGARLKRVVCFRTFTYFTFIYNFGVIT